MSLNEFPPAASLSNQNQPTETETISIPFLPWDEFVNEEFRWYQGEHVAAIGPTNSGKTTLLLSLVRFRKYVVVVGTKPEDSTLDRLLVDRGFKRLDRWEKLDPRVYPRRLLWPKAGKLDSLNHQRAEILRAFQAIYREKRWALFLDELWFIIHQLKLEISVRTYLTQARSLRISLVLGTQRPAFVPLEVYDQSTHLFFWRDNDERNLKRISGISWLSARLVQRTVANLDAKRHEVLYINTRSGRMVRTIAPAPERKSS